MNYLTLPQFKAVLRDFSGAADLDPVYTQALDAAEGAIDRFVGFDVSVEFAGEIPAPVQSAGYQLATIEVEAMDAAREQQVRARVESLLRPYRREVGFAGSGSEVTP